MEAIFFPRNDYPNNVEVCAHRLGKKMTYTEDTDGLHTESSYIPFVSIAKERNIKVSIFSGAKISGTTEDIVKNDYLNEKIWLDIYSLTPNIADKVTNHEQISKEEWDAAYDYIYTNFYEFTGKKPVALSYAYNNTTFKDYTTQFLGGRKSGHTGNTTNYGVGFGNPDDVPYSFSEFCCKESSINWYDTAKLYHDSDFRYVLDNIVSPLIDQTKINGGWLNNFTHWHHYYRDGNEQWAEAYLDLLASKNENNDIYFAGYGEAIAYLVYRQIISKVAMYTPVQKSDTLIIQIETKNTLNVDTDLLQIPISIKFSTANTPLENEEIESKQNLINLGNNEYIVEIPYSEYPRSIITKKYL